MGKNITATLLVSCPDKKGLVARIANFIYERNGNIIDLDEHVDDSGQRFFLRVSWAMDGFNVKPEKLHDAFSPLEKEYGGEWNIKLSTQRHRIAIFVSQYDHCLQEILWRKGLEEFDADISMIISNHDTLEYLAGRYNIPFYLFPITKETKAAQEEKEIELLTSVHITTIILARYMQVLSPKFVSQYRNRIINIHHSFLPAFAGGNPYKQAFDRGVKIVGATSHYVTDTLDDGPIIEQDIVRISHKDSLDDLKRKGRDLERLVLARAVRLHLQDRVLVYKNKTVVFD